MEYLGHIVFHEVVKVYHNKIKAIKEWKVPTTITQLHRFLRLTGYYRKIFKNYGRIAAPPTTLLKKDAFSWTPEATKAFIVECDASRNGIGVFLTQEGRPIAFESC